ncbi:DUF2911 domain-containing protein [Chitinophagaceae bacterium 26-R-25]|nr:DUF2911 domain-containing protein [Chitinophagaceae bacterium 26-R-25]
MKKLFIACCLLGALHFDMTAQGLKVPAPSPTQTVKQDFALSSIEITYSRPVVNGRKIFGDLVPYGKLWRTGANGATKIAFGEDVTIGGQKVKAGEYALYTIPNAGEWEIILNTGVKNGGVVGYKESEDVARFKVKSNKLKATVESFTIEVADVKSNMATINIIWDKTSVSIPVSADIDGKIMAQIQENMKSDKPAYFQAGMYYVQTNRDLNQAITWFDKAIEQNPKGFFIYYQKAKALAALGKKEEAKATAQKSIELSKEAGNEDYVALNEKLLATLK